MHSSRLFSERWSLRSPRIQLPHCSSRKSTNSTRQKRVCSCFRRQSFRRRLPRSAPSEPSCWLFNGHTSRTVRVCPIGAEQKNQPVPLRGLGLKRIATARIDKNVDWNAATCRQCEQLPARPVLRGVWLSAQTGSSLPLAPRTIRSRSEMWQQAPCRRLPGHISGIYGVACRPSPRLCPDCARPGRQQPGTRVDARHVSAR
jgi:hypothetical protein